MTRHTIKIPAPFDPDEFRKEGHKIVDSLAKYLKEALAGSDIPVLPINDPDHLAKIFSFDSGGGDKEQLVSFIDRIIKYSNHLHHPHYIGHQVTSPLPVATLVQFCTTLLNNGAAIYEMGPVNMAMERNVVDRFGAMIGYSTKYDGIFTHGGTAGNLTAMLAARQNKTKYNIWKEGVRVKGKPAYMMPEHAHYSIGKNVRIMGLGDESIILVPSDKHFRMRTDKLEELKAKAEKNGISLICVVANACSTATGSYDDLEMIADFCEKYNLWMHVDGTHGMGVLFSDKYKNRVKGVERADSVVIDFHKMLLVPALNTLVMFRSGEKSYETFAQKASYLFRKSQNNTWYNSAIRTIECTKSALGIVAYTVMKYYGSNYYKEYIDSRYDLAHLFAEMLRSEKDFELATEPDANIVCLRFAPDGMNVKLLNKINTAIREEIIREGSFYIVQVELDGKVYIRLTIINPITSEKDLQHLLLKIREIGIRNMK